jgi:sugar phosphate isomerase/epimerase
MNQRTTLRWSLEEDLFRYRAAGISAVGLLRKKVIECGEDRCIELLHESGLEVSNLVWAGGFTGSGGHSFREALEESIEMIQFAAAVDCPTLIVHSGARGGHTLNHARRLFAKAIKELLPAAQAFNVTLAVEPMHPKVSANWTVYPELLDTLDLVRSMQSDHLKMVVDTYHLGLESGLVELLPEILPHIAVVHLADGRSVPKFDQERCRLGNGIVPLESIVATLLDYGYEGDFDVELFGSEIERSNYIELLNHSKAVYERLLQRVPA